jgi:hypothetical protein
MLMAIRRASCFVSIAPAASTIARPALDTNGGDPMTLGCRVD